MNHDDPHRKLLDDLYPPPSAGPDCDIVISMVRAHRVARCRRRGAAVLSLLITLGAAAFFLRDTPQAPPLLAAKPPPQMRQLNDEELLDVFPGQPAAIATLPDGTQRLLLVVKATH